MIYFLLHVAFCQITLALVIIRSFRLEYFAESIVPFAACAIRGDRAFPAVAGRNSASSHQHIKPHLYICVAFTDNQSTLATRHKEVSDEFITRERPGKVWPLDRLQMSCNNPRYCIHLL